MASNNIFSYGHGQLIEKGSASTGYNSIMAYGTTGYRRKANYYSNPDVIFPGTGTPTGVAGVSNNAKVLNEMIGQMAALGDESGTCGYVPPSTTTTTTAPTTTTAASCVINESSYICAGNNALDSKKVADWQECANHCASIASCEVGFHNITLVHFPSRKRSLHTILLRPGPSTSGTGAGPRRAPPATGATRTGPGAPSSAAMLS